jgi:hypothetical protein
VYLTLMRDTWAHRLVTVKLDLGDPAKDHLALRYFQAERELRETLKALGVERRVTRTVTPAAWLEALKPGS